MNKKSIKYFAISARENLIEKVKDKAFEIGETEEKKIEEASYVYFFMLIALRYMEVNDYLPTELWVFSSRKQHKKTEFIKQKLLNAWNILREMLPFVFQNISEDMQVLFPDLLEDDPLILDLCNAEIISNEDWREVEIIGWFYQYYMSYKHKEIVKLNRSRIKKEDIGAATQMFTPKWIVKYMVENTLGKFWVEKTKDKRLEKKLEFYIENEEGIEKSKNRIDPKSIKVFDPACGAGHILVYAFDVFYDIYKQAGYEEKDIPIYILKYNLYGLDIDEKATSLANFALTMKGREKDHEFFQKIRKEKFDFNICAIEESNGTIKDKEMVFYKIAKQDMPYAKKQIDHLLQVFYDAKEYGSIIEMGDFDEKFWDERVETLKAKEIKTILEKLVRVGKMIKQKYEIVIANPPYLSNKMMSLKLKKYVDEYFEDYNGDLFSVFMKRNLDYTKEDGYAAFMTPFVWMFIKRYEKLRKYIVSNKGIESLVQLEYSGFQGATVPICTFVLRNNSKKDLGDFIKLSDFKGEQNQPIKALEAIKNKRTTYRYRRATKSFEKIPGMPIAYWVSDEVKAGFQKGLPLEAIADARVGLQTSNNKRFVRLWYEVDRNHIGFGFKDRESAKNSEYKWFPYNKGGHFRKWYGNHTYVVNWKNDGAAIRTYNGKLNASRSSNIGIANTAYYFKKGITWSFVSSAKFGVRITEEGFLFDTAGSSAFPTEEQIYFLIALLCSKVTYVYLMILNPTLNFQPGNIAMLPVLFPEDEAIKVEIDYLARACIHISKNDWDAYEHSWDFQKHPFLMYKKGACTIEKAFENWHVFKQNQFEKLKEHEEKLNKIFIDMYQLEKDLMPNVDDGAVTIKRADKERDVRSFISFAVGCMFGRYSLDKEGLDVVLEVDKGGIMLIKDDFGKDIVSRFIAFLKITFGEDALNENLSFIADALGRKKESSMACIRGYFMYDFYKDHVKTYKKHPIYWLFTSGKNKAFQALVYVHRFDKDTINNIRKKYLHKIIERKAIEKRIMEKKLREERECNKEILKNIIFIKKQLSELKEYDKTMKQIENMKIEIDLDDGVSTNYQKFDKVLEKI
ncbi:BREX-1 system adenine-specific DNA-methyltransferase PglX [Marinisporobacter balticus]|uniref:site-specific DNA-methyltransferase (adenine-specific) n=1 Tax=Marinisporobacter balticus TaxID=2018667 RepID=A0A4R2KYL8_9FIRM|nr:BREX-1 system adenine-specific DNA-methyltransferase PglX [Marinisporobacter balticus]TCO76509.1 N-6 DNA methylase [Marinisporobacter balticus]